MVSSISFVIAFRHFIHGQLQRVDGITLSFKQRHRAQIDGRASLVRETESMASFGERKRSQSR